VIFNHVALNINIRKISRFGEGLPLIEIIIGVPKISDKIVLSSISITKDKDGEYIVETNIRNDYREIPGLGMALWELSQTTIQKIAVQLNKSITVVVNQQPSQGLSDNKWNKLFLPLLNKYGYKKVDYVGDIRDNLWERIYTPNHG